MKLIDKNGKLFEKISLLDILIVICVAFISLIFILNRNEKISLPVSTKSDIEYTVDLKAYSVDKGMRSPFEVGDKLYASTGEFIGEILSVEEKITVSKEKLQNGTYVDYENPRYVDYFIRVKGNGTVTDKGVFAEGTFALYPNNSITVGSTYFYGNVVVLSVKN